MLFGGVHEVFFHLVQLYAVVVVFQVVADALFGAEPVAGGNEPGAAVGGPHLIAHLELGHHAQLGRVGGIHGIDGELSKPRFAV